jgi:hypothetical protein
MPMGAPEHRSFRIQLDGDRAFAVCTCEWQSDPALNAGMAGAMWDRHVADARVDA